MKWKGEGTKIEEVEAEIDVIDVILVHHHVPVIREKDVIVLNHRGQEVGQKDVTILGLGAVKGTVIDLQVGQDPVHTIDIQGVEENLLVIGDMHLTENLQADTVQVEKGLIRSQFQGKSHQVENAQLVKIVSVQVVHIPRLRHHHPRHPVAHQVNRLISKEHLRQKRKV